MSFDDDVFDWAASTDEEIAIPISYYMTSVLQGMGTCSPSREMLPQHISSNRKARQNQSKGEENTSVSLEEFFSCPVKGLAWKAQDDDLVDSATQSWIRSALQSSPNKNLQRANFRRSREVRRVKHTVTLPSGHTFTTIDSQPAQRDNADRTYSRNLALWEALPRGHAEVHEGDAEGPLLCEIAALRKFGGADEKFGPLAREAGGARRLALQTLPTALANSTSQGDQQEVSLVFLTKENGEMCKVSFFELDATHFLVLGSKNVVLVISMSSREVALEDLMVYEESRFSFPKEMAQVFVDRFFDILNEDQRCSLVGFVVSNKATLCGESISPLHQHIQSYQDPGEGIASHIRFFAITSPESFDACGLTLIDPVDAIAKFSDWGLLAAELCEEAMVRDPLAVAALEEKHLSLPNREGAVVYVVVRQHGSLNRLGSRTAVVYKWKNSWYVTVRAMREKFCARSSESRILDRIRLLHIHHPQEKELVVDFLGFYRWVLLLLPSQGFGDVLAESWVSLKGAYDAFMSEITNWDGILPIKLRMMLTEAWLEVFPSLHAALVTKIAPGDWISVLSQHRHKIVLNAAEAYGDKWIEEISEVIRSSGGFGPQSARQNRSLVDADADISLSAILVRGLQGSGKSSLCRALCNLLGGQWINQDEVAGITGGKKRGMSAKDLFLQAIEKAASKEEVKYIFVDKIHTLRQHRSDVCAAIKRGFAKRGAAKGRITLALLNLSHPEDDEGQCAHAISLCTDRIVARGVGHLTLVPQAANAEAVIKNTSQDAEVFEDSEKCSFDLYANVNMNQTSKDLLQEAIGKLMDGSCIKSNDSFTNRQLDDAVNAARSHEIKLRNQWRTLYWCIDLDWPSILNGADDLNSPDEHECLRTILAQSIAEAQGLPLQAVEDPHVTLLWIGNNTSDASMQQLDSQISAYEGQQATVKAVAVCSDLSLGLVAIRVVLDQPPCANLHPHITAAMLPGVRAMLSNDMLQRQADGDSRVVQKALAVPLVLKGTVRRKLAPESLAKVAGGGPLAESGSPLCELGLAATEEATDVFATYDASARHRRILAKLSSLICQVDEPLRHCTGWPPSLRGKLWFTFHERPLGSESIAALRYLEGRQLQTLHIGALYFEAVDLLVKDLAAMSEQFEDKISGQGVEALRNALLAWRSWQQTEKHVDSDRTIDTEQDEQISFYVQCKAAGSQDQVVRFRQAVAFTIAKLMGWEPKLKDADVTISAQVKDDWVLLGLVVPPAKDRKAKPKQQAKLKVVADPSAVKSSPSPPEDHTPPVRGPSSSIPGVMDIDGAFMEGGGQILRSTFAYGAVLGRSVRVYNIRGGRNNPGLRPSHTVAIEAIQKIAGGELSGNTVKSSDAMLLRHQHSVPLSNLQEPLIFDAGTGGSTMLILQALLPVLLARSAALGGSCVSVILKGGTNVASPNSSSCSFRLTAPQVDYVQLVLFPMLRRLFGITLDLQLVKRGFLQGGGEVRVSAATPEWPLPAFELVDPGEASQIAGIVYSSAGIPKHVLGRMLEGETKRRPSGASVRLRDRLPTLSVEWEPQEVEKSNGGDACGLVVAIGTTAGCFFGGDSMGRKGVPAEKVGEEAAQAALAALTGGGCADEFLEDQLVIFMALANGTSRLRLSSTAEESLHTRTACWLAELFGACIRVLDDSAGRVLEIDGIGSSLVKLA